MNYFNNLGVKEIIINALKEDIAAGDITGNNIVRGNKQCEALVLAKEDCVVCGLAVACSVFRQVDKKINFKQLGKDGNCVKRGKVIARLTGKARSILAAERTALNFLSRLCGIATMTRKFVEKVKPYRVRIMDTRKTTPGLRALEKYAIRIGGGYNHRFSLDEMMLIKDNHLKVIGGISKIKSLDKRYKAEIEVKSLNEFRYALDLKPDIIMLDNMSIKEMKKAVKIRNSQLITHNSQLRLEASGGVTLKNVKKIAATGVDMISVGELTHSAPAVDISLEIL